MIAIVQDANLDALRGLSRRSGTVTLLELVSRRHRRRLGQSIALLDAASKDPLEIHLRFHRQRKPLVIGGKQSSCGEKGKNPNLHR